MQAIAPDFHTPFGGRSSTQKEERAGEGAFESLLREEDARYDRYETEARTEPERAEATPSPSDDHAADDYTTNEPLRDEPLRDEPRRDEPRRDEPRRDEPRQDEPLRDARDNQPDDPADGPTKKDISDPQRPHEAQNAPAGGPTQMQVTSADDAAPPQGAAVGGGSAAQGSLDTTSNTSAGAMADPAPDAAQTAPSGKADAPATQQPSAAGIVVPGQDTRNATAAAMNSKTAIASGKAEPSGKAELNGKAVGGKAVSGKAATEAVTAPATAAAPETLEGDLPGSAAAPATKAAGKASQIATSKEANPVASVRRQSPATVPATSGETSARTGSQASNNAAPPAQNVTVETTEGLSSRPAAALGGGAATAALAQDGQASAIAGGQAKTEMTDGEAAPQVAALNKPFDKPASQAGQAAKGAEIATGAADKAAQAVAAGHTPGGSSGGGESAGNSAGQPTLSAPATGGTAITGQGSVQNTSFAETLANARPTAAADPAEQIAVQVRRAQVAGQEQINIKLHPAELGRIEVKLESNPDGTLRAVISAERSETLDLMQRDARGLERALQDAGVKTDSGSLNFNLRGQGQQQQAGDDTAPGRRGPDAAAPVVETGEAAQTTAPQPGSYHNGALDIRV